MKPIKVRNLTVAESCPCDPGTTRLYLDGEAATIELFVAEPCSLKPGDKVSVTIEKE